MWCELKINMIVIKSDAELASWPQSLNKNRCIVLGKRFVYTYCLFIVAEITFFISSNEQ